MSQPLLRPRWQSQPDHQSHLVSTFFCPLVRWKLICKKLLQLKSCCKIFKVWPFWNVMHERVNFPKETKLKVSTGNTKKTPQSFLHRFSLKYRWCVFLGKVFWVWYPKSIFTFRYCLTSNMPTLFVFLWDTKWEFDGKTFSLRKASCFVIKLLVVNLIWSDNNFHLTLSSEIMLELDLMTLCYHFLVLSNVILNLFAVLGSNVQFKDVLRTLLKHLG